MEENTKIVTELTPLKISEIIARVNNEITKQSAPFAASKSTLKILAYTLETLHTLVFISISLYYMYATNTYDLVEILIYSNMTSLIFFGWLIPGFIIPIAFLAVYFFACKAPYERYMKYLAEETAHIYMLENGVLNYNTRDDIYCTKIVDKLKIRQGRILFD